MNRCTAEHTFGARMNGRAEQIGDPLIEGEIVQVCATREAVPRIGSAAREVQLARKASACGNAEGRCHGRNIGDDGGNVQVERPAIQTDPAVH
ncbi:MAG: hypothetical protein ACREE7_19720, partial [Dongiaceae bacterium]